jgi:hypothetical protein
MRQAQVEDWLEDLIEFGPAAVADACREWRRSPVNRRPVPGEIRKLCIEAEGARTDERHTANDPWPHWLEEIYGPLPEGPRRREEALRQTAEHKREVEQRLNDSLGKPPP